MSKPDSNKLPEAEYLWSIFAYEDGALTWKPRPVEHFKNRSVFSMWNAKFANKVAGRTMPTAAYRQVMVDSVRYLEHRIIAQMLGIDISNEIDHIDGNGLNNRAENLRAATRAQNMRNNSGWGKKSSRVGTWRTARGKWIAYIRVDGRLSYLGNFSTEAEAVSAREAAERKHYGEFAFSHREQNAERVVPGIEGGMVVLGLSTSRMSKAEMSDLMMLIAAFGAERGVVWSEPE